MFHFQTLTNFRFDGRVIRVDKASESRPRMGGGGGFHGRGGYNRGYNGGGEFFSSISLVGTGIKALYSPSKFHIVANKKQAGVPSSRSLRLQSKLRKLL